MTDEEKNKIVIEKVKTYSPAEKLNFFHYILRLCESAPTHSVDDTRTLILEVLKAYKIINDDGSIADDWKAVYNCEITYTPYGPYTTDELKYKFELIN